MAAPMLAASQVRANAVNNYFGAMLRYFEFGGRSSRREYWWYSVTIVVLSFGAMMIDIKYLNAQSFESSPLLLFVIFTHVIPGITMTVRRLHDAGCSGWWYWISLVPVIGGFWLFYLTGIKGPTYESEQYGPDPRDADAVAPATRPARAQPQTRAQFMMQQMEDRRRRMA